jgi:hypothetical protein
MGAAILQLGCTVQCPHGAMVLVIPSQQRVLLNNQPALLPADAAMVVGCPFNISGKPQPCVTVSWSGEASHAQVNGQGPLLESSVGLCKSAEGVVQGTVLISGVQTKASAT